MDILPKCIISDNKLQFAAKLTKVLNSMVGIETILLTVFHLQTDRQIKQIKQELEYYLRFLQSIDREIGQSG